jgi:hypothetical protein
VSWATSSVRSDCLPWWREEYSGRTCGPFAPQPVLFGAWLAPAGHSLALPSSSFSIAMLVNTRRSNEPTILGCFVRAVRVWVRFHVGLRGEDLEGVPFRRTGGVPE